MGNVFSIFLCGCNHYKSVHVFGRQRYVFFCIFAAVIKQSPNPKVALMEKRIGTVTVLVKDRAVAPQVNAVISQYADIILARQGLPFRDSSVAVISLIVDGDNNQINALSGKLGRIEHIEAKVVVTKSA